MRPQTRQRRSIYRHSYLVASIIKSYMPDGVNVDFLDDQDRGIHEKGLGGARAGNGQGENEEMPRELKLRTILISGLVS